ncbi:MAG: large conductance mechanosensitive channel protein MscL [Coriobacteriales bacterium]|nr:large conductance mechanosensitive channel protein MscL [Coriobacteriales bacterium]
MKGFAEEFKKFITRGNVMDMAVGIIIGGAFTAIVTSFVNDILMPLLGILIGGVDFGHLSFNVGSATIGYGAFISAIINFLLVAWAIFIVVKGMNKMREAGDKLKKKEEEEAAEAAPEPRLCPYCKSEVHAEATKCPHCASEIPLEG